MAWRHLARWAALVAAIAAMGAACRGSEPRPSPATSDEGPNVLRVLAGSELKDLAADLTSAARRANVDLQLSYAGTLDIVDRVNGGEAFDAVLPPNGAYPMLALTAKPAAREKLFYSRVALGVKRSRAQALGWDRQRPSWADIARSAGAGQFSYAMTNPTTSNTGMSALFAVASSAAGKTDDLRLPDVNRDVLAGFLKGQALTAGSSGWLTERAGVQVIEREPANDQRDGLVAGVPANAGDDRHQRGQRHELVDRVFEHADDT